jgi:hypothetical protein
MGRNIQHPSLNRCGGWLRFMLPFFVLLHSLNAFAGCNYQDIDTTACPGGQGPDAKYDNPGGTAITDKIALCPTSTFTPIWTLQNSAGCAAPTGPIGAQSMSCGPMTLAVPPGGVPTFSGTTLNGPAIFTVIASDSSNTSNSCQRQYVMNVNGQGGWGDPHITTIDGVHYNFQGAGEFTALRGTGMELQTRQTPVSTSYIPAADTYDNVQTCVSVYSAVAARVGSHKFSYQPILSADGAAAASGMQLRVDGTPTTLTAAGIALAGSPVSGKIVQPWGGDGVEVDYSDGTTLIVTPSYWSAQQLWYLNVNVYGGTAAQAVYGRIAERSWLPALANGASLGPMPESLTQRYTDLYVTFADSWRVSAATSLFDYAPGTSTADFTRAGWPQDNPTSCTIPGRVLAQPVAVTVAENACSAIADPKTHADCVFDVTATGYTGFAKTYQLSQERLPGASRTTLKADKDVTALGESVTFTATSTRTGLNGGGTPVGTVQFVADGANVGTPMSLDASGQARWSTTTLAVGEHQIQAKFVSAKGWGALNASNSAEEKHEVIAATHFPMWLIILLVIILVIVLLWWMLK